MSVPRLPEHLELLLSDEPVLDIYAYGPWRVPDGRYEDIAARARELVADPRAQELVEELSPPYRSPASALVPDLPRCWPSCAVRAPCAAGRRPT